MVQAAERVHPGRGLPWLLVFAAGCRLAEVAPEPIRGAAPASIAVWPSVGGDYQGDCAVLLDALTAAIAARGYRTVTWPIVLAMLGEDARGSPSNWPRIGQATAADAVMQVLVREFTATGTRPLREARWDLEWRLMSTRDGAVVWSQTHRGSWVAPRDEVDPNRALDAEPDVVPIGGDSRIVYRDGRELLAALHRLVMARLPARSR